MKAPCVSICGLLLAVVPFAGANPIDPNQKFVPLFVLVGLIAEALVISGLLARRKFRFLRIFVAWLPVTLVTYWLTQFGYNRALDVLGAPQLAIAILGRRNASHPARSVDPMDDVKARVLPAD
jgi:hypothetical protein